MPVMDEFRQEREMMKNRSFKERIEYFWEYYKWYVIGGIVGVLVLISIIHDIVTHKEDILQVAMINYYHMNAEDTSFSDNFVSMAGYDATKEKLTLLDELRFTDDNYSQETYTAKQQVSVYMAAQSLDVFMAVDSIFSNYAYDQCFIDLKDLLSPEDYSYLEEQGLLYYIDASLYELREQFKDDISDDSVWEYPDPSDPASMKEPVAVGVMTADSKPLLQSYLPISEEPISAAGIVRNIDETRQSLGKDFVLYLVGQMKEASSQAE